MISYADNFEDVLLNRCFKDEQFGFYIDIGAMHPVESSITKHFYDKGWRGINIEPVQKYFQLLCKERTRDINLDIALGKTNEVLEFYEFETRGLSTLNQKVMEQHKKNGHFCQKRNITVYPLSEICEKHILDKAIDFLKLDTEGFAGQIIRGADWQKFRPKILIIEANTFSWQDYEHILLDNDYIFVYYDRLNRYYLRKENDKLRKHFEAPLNHVLDNFISYRQYLLQEHVNLQNITLRKINNKCLELQKQNDILWAELKKIYAAEKIKVSNTIKLLIKILCAKTIKGFRTFKVLIKKYTIECIKWLRSSTTLIKIIFNRIRARVSPSQSRP